MIPELVEQLRQLARRQRQYGAPNDEQIDRTCSLTISGLDEAADTIEALQAENARLDAECERAWSAYRIAHDQAMKNGEAAAIARAALEGES